MVTDCANVMQNIFTRNLKYEEQSQPSCFGRQLVLVRAHKGPRLNRTSFYKGPPSVRMARSPTVYGASHLGAKPIMIQGWKSH